MAHIRPQTKADLGKISGVGSKKLADYGDNFLSAIRGFCQDNNIKTQKVEVKPTPVDNSPSSTELTTLKLHQQGMSIDEIAQERNIRPTTVIRHLSDLIEKNEAIDINLLVPVNKQKVIWKVLDTLGDVALTPIKEYLGDDYSFDEIRIVKGVWRRKSKK